MPEEKSVYDEILEENQDESSKTKKEDSEEESEESETDEKAQTDEERKITKEDLKELGLSKTFLGKPYEKTLKTVVVQLGKWNTQQSQKLSALEKEFGDLKVKLTPKEKQEVKEEVEDKLPEMPDPFEKPKEFKEWLDKRDQLTTKALRKEFEDKLKEQDTRGKVGEFEAKENSALLWEKVDEGLQTLLGDEFKPEITDQILKEFGEYLDEMEEEDFKTFDSVYHKKPVKLAAEVLRWYKAELYDRAKNPKKTEKKETKETHKEKVDRLKNKNKSFIQSASSSRDKAKEEETTSPYQEIIEEYQKKAEEESE